MVGITVVAAEDRRGPPRRLFTSLQQAFVALRRGTPGMLKPPVDDIDAIGSMQERAGVDHALRYAIVGGPDRVRVGLETLLEQTQADELIVSAQIYDQAARHRSYEILAEVRNAIGADRVAA